MRKILVGISDSECAERTVDFVSSHLAGSGDLEVTVVHVLPNLPAVFWDEGHILSDTEKQERQRVVDTWASKQRAKVEPVMRSAVDAIVATGMPAKNARIKFISDSTDVADSLLEEAVDGKYQAIVISRSRKPAGTAAHIGSVAHKLAQKAAAGIAVCIAG
ncbi:MAG: universal stress protein [Nitrospiraceae bacterium]|nr:universal stress protein [Nitrospiraceae bacterium]